ncbi:MAG: nucleotidyltransferase family protein, partial [Gemmatimonadota bacterium]|nr:nucleotidyltransferase family protein [Gemmatimonadota bacterium]
PTLGFLWPAPQQLLLLDAALLEGDAARAAFREWRNSVKLEEEFSWTVLRLLPLVHDTLAKAGEHDILMGRLKGMTRRAFYETQQLFHRVRPAIATLMENGIPVMLLKGAPMVVSYFRHHALRPMTDVDICIPPADVRRAIALLLKGGWKPATEPSPDYLRFRHALQFFHPNGGELDLHWHVLYEGLARAEDPWGWQDAEPMNFAGLHVLQPSPTNLLLLLVVHGVRWNEETPVRWIPDAMMVLRRRFDAINWSQLVADARSLKVTQRLSLGLQWLVTRYNAPIPATVLAELRAVNPTLTERVEGRVYLRDSRMYENSLIGNQFMILADLCRFTDPANPVKFAATLPAYLRYRWELNGRREIVPAIWRAVRRRLRGEVPLLHSIR